MIISCGSCQSKFKIDPAKVPAGGARIRCPKCKGVIAVGPVAPSAPAPAPASAAGPRPGASQPAAQAAAGHPDDLVEHGDHAGVPNPTHAPDGSPAPVVGVAHGNAAFAETLAGFLRRNHFACETVHDGEGAMALLSERRPAVLLVDVALPGIVGYKLCEQVKSDPRFAGMRVVLIGAIYDRTRYRRPPASLYGSDGYIEKHEIPEKLVPMLRVLAAGGAPSAEAGAPRSSPALEDAGATVGSAEAEAAFASFSVEPGSPAPSPARPEAAAPPGPASGSEQARRLARIIVSDIVLYNPDVVKKGIADGNLPHLLKDELKEGRDLLKARMGGEASGADYVLEALEDYVRRMSARGPAAAQR